jgi:hypothetical protein
MKMLIYWGVPCAVVNCEETNSSMEFYKAMKLQLITLTKYERSFVSMFKKGTHICNLTTMGLIESSQSNLKVFPKYQDFFVQIVQGFCYA